MTLSFDQTLLRFLWIYEIVGFPSDTDIEVLFYLSKVNEMQSQFIVAQLLNFFYHFCPKFPEFL